jgi:hypothetical protein
MTEYPKFAKVFSMEDYNHEYFKSSKTNHDFESGDRSCSGNSTVIDVAERFRPQALFGGSSTGGPQQSFYGWHIDGWAFPQRPRDDELREICFSKSDRSTVDTFYDSGE